MPMALRRLRKFARQGAAEELDIDGTIGLNCLEQGIVDVQLVSGTWSPHQSTDAI